MFNDNFHQLAAKNRQKVSGPRFTKTFSILCPQLGANFPNLKNASKTLSIIQKTCFMTFYND